MANRPTDDLTWAEDPAALVSEPTNERTRGFPFEFIPPVDQVNWLQRGVGRWIDYFAGGGRLKGSTEASQRLAPGDVGALTLPDGFQAGRAGSSTGVTIVDASGVGFGEGTHDGEFYYVPYFDVFDPGIPAVESEIRIYAISDATGPFMVAALPVPDGQLASIRANGEVLALSSTVLGATGVVSVDVYDASASAGFATRFGLTGASLPATVTGSAQVALSGGRLWVIVPIDTGGGVNRFELRGWDLNLAGIDPAPSVVLDIEPLGPLNTANVGATFEASGSDRLLVRFTNTANTPDAIYWIVVDATGTFVGGDAEYINATHKVAPLSSAYNLNSIKWRFSDDDGVLYGSVESASDDVQLIGFVLPDNPASTIDITAPTPGYLGELQTGADGVRGFDLSGDRAWVFLRVASTGDAIGFAEVSLDGGIRLLRSHRYADDIGAAPRTDGQFIYTGFASGSFGTSTLQILNTGREAVNIIRQDTASGRQRGMKKIVPY